MDVLGYTIHPGWIRWTSWFTSSSQDGSVDIVDYGECLGLRHPLRMDQWIFCIMVNVLGYVILSGWISGYCALWYPSKMDEQIS